MAVLGEAAILAYLRRALDVLEAIYECLEAEGTSTARGAPLEGYQSLVRDLEAERTVDEHLDDDRWSWILRRGSGRRVVHRRRWRRGRKHDQQHGRSGHQEREHRQLRRFNHADRHR